MILSGLRIIISPVFQRSPLGSSFHLFSVSSHFLAVSLRRLSVKFFRCYCKRFSQSSVLRLCRIASITLEEAYTSNFKVQYRLVIYQKRDSTTRGTSSSTCPDESLLHFLLISSHESLVITHPLSSINTNT
jgi:hypothetical protein